MIKELFSSIFTKPKVNRTTKTYALGLQESPPDDRDYLVKIDAPVISTVPDVFVIKNLPPIRNQLNLGSCASFAAVGAYETILLNYYPKKFVELSERYHYYNVRKNENGTFPFDNGQTIRDACQTMLDYGNVFESVCPYEPSKFNEAPSPVAYMFSKFYKITAYRKIVNFDDIFPIISSNTPVVCGFKIYDSFYSLNPKMYQYFGTGKYVGGHAMQVVGYDKTKQVFVVKNQWGPTWGNNGVFLIDFETFKQLSFDWYVVEIEGGKVWSSV